MAFFQQYQSFLNSADNADYHPIDIGHIKSLLRCVPSPLRGNAANGPCSYYNPMRNITGDSNGLHCDEMESSGYNSSAGNLIDCVSTSNANKSTNATSNNELNVEYESEVNVAQQQIRIVGGNRGLVELTASILNEAFGKAEAAKQLLKLDGLFNVVDDVQLFNKINRIVDELPMPMPQPIENQNEVIAVANEEKMVEAISERPRRPRRTHFNYETYDADEIDASRPRRIYGKAELISVWESTLSTLPHNWSQIARNFPGIVRR